MYFDIKHRIRSKWLNFNAEADIHINSLSYMKIPPSDRWFRFMIFNGDDFNNKNSYYVWLYRVVVRVRVFYELLSALLFNK